MILRPLSLKNEVISLVTSQSTLNGDRSNNCDPIWKCIPVILILDNLFSFGISFMSFKSMPNLSSSDPC